MGSIQNLVKWVKDRTSRKKKTTKDANIQKVAETDTPPSNRSSIYGFHRSKAKGGKDSKEDCSGKEQQPQQQQVCENTLYTPSSAVTATSPFRLYNDSPAHVYEEIPGALVSTNLRQDETRGRLNINLKNLDFTEAKEVGPYLLVPIRKQNLNEKNNQVGLIRTKDLVDVVQSTENLDCPQTELENSTTNLCSTETYRSNPSDENQHISVLETSIYGDDYNPPDQNTRQVVAEVHHSSDDLSSGNNNNEYNTYIHCKKCKRPHGIYDEDFMEHYNETDDDNVFDEPDIIKDSQIKDQDQNTSLQTRENGEFDCDLYSDESVYGIREQIYSTTDELIKQEDQILCKKCVSQTKYSSVDNFKSKGQSRPPYWKKYVSMGNFRKRLSNKEGEIKTQALDIPTGISYSSVSTRLSPNTQLLLDGQHYKTLPIDLVTPVKPSSAKKPFGYDKLELSNRKIGVTSLYNMPELPKEQNKTKSSRSRNSSSGPKWLQAPERKPRDIKSRSASCSDIRSNYSEPKNCKPVDLKKSRNTSTSEECEYMSMAHVSSPRGDSISTSSDLSPSGVAMEKKKTKILKLISKNKENLITINPPGGQKSRSISMTENDIYNCDAETKRKVNLLTRNKLSSTWNGPRTPPRGVQHMLSRHSTLPHSFCPSPQRGLPPQKSPHLMRSSDSLLLPKQLSSRDFHTLNKHSPFPGSLYLRQGGLQGKLKEQQMLRKRRFASSSDCLLSSTIAEETNCGSTESLPRPFPRGRSLSYDGNAQTQNLSLDANAQTYSNAAAIAQNQASSYRKRHNPILSDLMRVNNDRQTLMLV